MPKHFKSWWDFMSFSHAVTYKSRFVHDKVIEAFLDTLYQSSKTRHRRISKDKCVWRAQLGATTVDMEQDGVEYTDPAPYPAKRMKPLAHAAQEGRVNPKGIPCLYVANDKETAMSEVRPAVGSEVSLAQLMLNREVTLVDFSAGHDDESTPFFFEEPPPKKREKAIWTQLERAFSKPVATDHATAEYVPTQVIAEFFKKKGFDGVVYKSRLGPGYNIALFDLGVADVMNGQLYTVKSVDFAFASADRGYNVNKSS
ncbi:RES family NAD+ phosphorylase [Duganella sp. Dugasp56]|uniref:RES family NAD+ phosphorylase n=1 Tax=Duganella sp. Dugasp56 TaxID=3243046 RepID=UPI0039B02143